jgi:DNA polymerase-3 subunit epsilon
LPTGKTFHRYLNPERDVPEEVVRVHGLTAAFLRDKPLFASTDVVDQLIEFFGDSPIIAHNAEFDRGFLNCELRLCGRSEFAQQRFIDTLPIAKALFPGAANSLDALSRRFQLDRLGFDLGKRKGSGGHGALLDAKMLAEVYLQLKGGRERKLVFTENEKEDTGGASTLTIVRRAARPTPLPIRTFAEDLDAHEAFVAELGEGALWKKTG